MKHLFYISFAFIALISCQNNSTSTKVEAKDSLAVEGESVSKELSDLNVKISKSPNDPVLYNERAKYYVKNNQLDFAYNDLAYGFKYDSLYMPLYNTLADYHLRKSEPAQAKAALDKALQINPKSYMTYVKLGELFYLVKKYDLAFENINKGLKINKYYSDAYFWKGMIYREQNKQELAMSNFMTAVEQDPDNFKAYMQMGLIELNNKSKAALDHFNAAVRVRPESTEGYYARAYYYQTNDDYDKAILDYTKVIEIDSTYATAHFNLGVLRYELRVIDLAFIDFSRAIKCNPKYAEAYYMRGLCEESKSLDEEAIADFEYALSLRPNYSLASQAIERVKNTIKIKDKR